MPKFVVYEVWSRAKVVAGANEQDVYSDYEPMDAAGTAANALGFALGNWHAVSVEDYGAPEPVKPTRKRRTRKPAPMVATATADETTVAILD